MWRKYRSIRAFGSAAVSVQAGNKVSDSEILMQVHAWPFEHLTQQQEVY